MAVCPLRVVAISTEEDAPSGNPGVAQASVIAEREIGAILKSHPEAYEAIEKEATAAMDLMHRCLAGLVTDAPARNGDAAPPPPLPAGIPA